MFYKAYEAVRILTRPMSFVLDSYTQALNHDLNPFKDTKVSRAVAALAEVPHRMLKDYPKQAFGVTVERDGETFTLPEQVVESLPFCDLVNFSVEDAAKKPKVLIAAALSGHHATLLRDTVRGIARDFDPYITDWKNARDVPLSDGDFGLDDYVSYLMAFMVKLGPGTHMVATCQAAPAALMAAAALVKRDPKHVPASLTLMAGPMDTRINQSFINKISDHVPLSLLQSTNITSVPKGFAGAGRRVYPGFIQLAGFVTLSLKPHVKRHGSFMKDWVVGDDDSAEVFRDFYDEYFAVLDMTESFYIDTLERIFFEHHIPTGAMTYEGELLDFDAIVDMPLLTIEGANDNMCSIGQTHAAHDICHNIPNKKRKHHVQEGVGHYGVFSGSKWQEHIYPVARDFINAHNG